VVEPLLPVFPDNYDLQTFRAYMLKNYAMIMRDQGRQADANRSLDEAAKMFAAVHEQNPNDASAWNGLGSVALLRGNPQLALQYIDQALFWQPGYPEALHDRELALGALKAQEKPPAH
jgi:tetratricopeptide (TPR) repeat protein